MNKIFEKMTSADVYERCVLAAAFHGVANGKFPMLAAEQSWDYVGENARIKNYSFQDLEGIRGTMSFKDDLFVCMLRNESSFISGEERLLREFFREAEEDIRKLAAEETMQYLLTDIGGKTVPAASAAFYGSGADMFSRQTEDEIMGISENVIAPYICSESEAAEHWKSYNDLTDEQAALAFEIYRQRLQGSGHIVPDIPVIRPLTNWFGGDISECIETFNEMDIFPE